MVSRGNIGGKFSVIHSGSLRTFNIEATVVPLTVCIKSQRAFSAAKISKITNTSKYNRFKGKMAYITFRVTQRDDYASFIIVPTDNAQQFEVEVKATNLGKGQTITTHYEALV